MAILDKVFKAAMDLKASDIHVLPGEPFMVRRLGTMIRLKSQPLSAANCRKVILEILTPEQRQTLSRDMQLDFAYEVKGLGRFRGSAMFHNNGMSCIFRGIPGEIP